MALKHLDDSAPKLRLSHKKLQGLVHAALGKDDLLSSLIAERGERVVNGLSSGSMKLNMALSGSPLIGYAWGRQLEIYGPESSGKTTLALHAILEAQRLERDTASPIPCLFVDAEHVLDVVYVENIGIDLDNLSISQPGYGEEALNVVEQAVIAGYKVIVIDSVSALTPRAEIEGEMGDSHMGLQARLMSQACRKLTGIISKAGAIVIFINQIRMKIGVVFGNPEVTSGGNALKFYASYRLEIRAPKKGIKTSKVKSLYEGDKEESIALGTVVNIKVVKNKCFPPYRIATFYIRFGEGIDRFRDALDFLMSAGAFKKSKSSDKLLLRLPSKGKSYTNSSRLLKMFRTDSDVQQDIIDHVHRIDEEMFNEK